MQDEAQSSTSEDEDEDMDGASPREETPDLYRNSALGMYGGVSAKISITLWIIIIFTGNG